MLVYKLVNTMNGKIYIGKSTCKTVKERWNRHIRAARRGTGFHLHRAISKYGPEAFKVEVLETAITSKAELSVREKYFIALFLSFILSYIIPILTIA